MSRMSTNVLGATFSSAALHSAFPLVTLHSSTEVLTMHNGESGSKRKTAVSETDVPAKRAAHVVVPAALLRTVAASLHAAMLDVMNVPCANVAARGRAVAAMDDCKRQLNDFLGIKRRVSQNCGRKDNVQGKVPTELMS